MRVPVTGWQLPVVTGTAGAPGTGVCGSGQGDLLEPLGSSSKGTGCRQRAEERVWAVDVVLPDAGLILGRGVGPGAGCPQGHTGEAWGGPGFWGPRSGGSGDLWVPQGDPRGRLPAEWSCGGEALTPRLSVSPSSPVPLSLTVCQCLSCCVTRSRAGTSLQSALPIEPSAVVGDPGQDGNFGPPAWPCHHVTPPSFFSVCGCPVTESILRHLFLMVSPLRLFPLMLLFFCLHVYASRRPCVFPSTRPPFRAAILCPAAPSSHSHCLPTRPWALCLALDIPRWIKANRVPVLKVVMFWWQAMHVPKSSQCSVPAAVIGVLAGALPRGGE